MGDMLQDFITMVTAALVVVGIFAIAMMAVSAVFVLVFQTVFDGGATMPAPKPASTAAIVQPLNAG